MAATAGLAATAVRLAVGPHSLAQQVRAPLHRFKETTAERQAFLIVVQVVVVLVQEELPLRQVLTVSVHPLRVRQLLVVVVVLAVKTVVPHLVATVAAVMVHHARRPLRLPLVQRTQAAVAAAVQVTIRSTTFLRPEVRASSSSDTRQPSMHWPPRQDRRP